MDIKEKEKLLEISEHLVSQRLEYSDYYQEELLEQYDYIEEEMNYILDNICNILMGISYSVPEISEGGIN